MKFFERLLLSVVLLTVCCYFFYSVYGGTTVSVITTELEDDRYADVDTNMNMKSIGDMEKVLDVIEAHLSVLRKQLSLNSSAEMPSTSDRLKSKNWLHEQLIRDPRLTNGQLSESLHDLALALLNTDEYKEEKANIVTAEANFKSSRSVGLLDVQGQLADVSLRDRNNVRLEADLREEIIETLQKHVDRIMSTDHKRKRKGMVMNIHKTKKNHPLAAWQKFHNSINQYQLYGEFDPNIDKLLEDLSSKTVVGLEEIADLGTQVKFALILNYGGKALFKPMRFDKDTEANPNHYTFDDFERHHAEIAAFHLDRVLNFRRVPPVSGRYLNITHDIKRWGSTKFKKTFFRSPASNLCFYGICDIYCDSGQAVCGQPDVIEGSLAVWLPDDALGVGRQHWENPWAQSYSLRKQPKWLNDSKFCDKVKSTSPYHSGRRLLDVIDMAIFDFMTGNMDRHHYHTFKDFGNYSFVLLFDNGRGFGRPKHDEEGLLAPLHQCCQIRASTLHKLLSFIKGPSLSEVMKKSLAKDAIKDVLNEAHLQALDRRLKFIVHSVYKCATIDSQWNNVIVDDGF